MMAEVLVWSVMYDAPTLGMCKRFLKSRIAAAKTGSGSGPLHEMRQAGTVISVVVIGVIALIGILIFAQIEDALPTIDNTELDAASTSVTDGFGNAMELIPIVLLVLVASLVIMTVQRMRGRGMQQ